MVKISILQHAPSSHLPTRPGDPTPTSRNLNPLMHPFARARERQRALNAVKMSRMFAKPFVASLEGHIDAVECMAVRMTDGKNSAGEDDDDEGSSSREVRGEVASGGWDGGILRHDLSTQTKIQHIPHAHKGKVSGVCYTNSSRLLSCGVDRTVKLWGTTSDSEPLSTFSAKAAFNAIDHHRIDPLFATASNQVHIWDENKSSPLSTLTHPTSSETLTSLKFNLAEPSLLGTTGSDRTFTLYDIRTGKAERRIVMQLSSTSLAWSPLLPTTFLLSSEDHNLYTFDLRALSSPMQVYKGHVSAVTNCAYSPTGMEFVSAGWDRTVRIWSVDARGEGNLKRERDTYHTKRMGRVSSVLFTPTSEYILSGSDDGNIRLWKTLAHKKLGVVTGRERAAIEYREKLVERWMGIDKEVRKIGERRYVPKDVWRAKGLKKEMEDSRRVKEERRRKHTREGEGKRKAEKKKAILIEQA